MKRALLIAALSIGLVAPAFAQHEGHTISAAPSTPPAPKPAPSPKSGAISAPPAAEHADNTADDAIAPPDAGNDIPPDPPTDFASDAFFPKAEMEESRGILRDEHGGSFHSKIMSNLLEYQSRNGKGGYRWEGQAWFGGDIDRIVIKTEGEGDRTQVEAGEAQALYSHAVGPYADLQVGLRHDFEPRPSRTYLALGVQALLPYWFDTEESLFVGERGQVLGRLEGTYDISLTQRLVLQPRAELNFAARNDAATRTGSGLTDAELGLRLRYEIRREFAPYIGISWERFFGDTANFVHLDGRRAETTSFVVGLRAWY